MTGTALDRASNEAQARFAAALVTALKSGAEAALHAYYAARRV
ncbi:hypothetical protein [Streptomyces sp. NPDC001515]